MEKTLRKGTGREGKVLGCLQRLDSCSRKILWDHLCEVLVEGSIPRHSATPSPVVVPRLFVIV